MSSDRYPSIALMPISSKNKNLFNSNVVSIDKSIPSSQISQKDISLPYKIGPTDLKTSLSLQKDKDAHLNYVISTITAPVSVDHQQILSKITTINPKYVLCNDTKQVLLVA